MRRTFPLVLIVLIAGCSSTPAAAPSPTPVPLTVGGTMSVPGSSLIGGLDSNPKPCVTTGGYSDIREGAQVVITDEASKTIALGSLEAGKPDSQNPARCVFPFSVQNVPAGRPFYGIEVSHRGRLQYTAEQIAMSLQLTLGD
ncbi:hypothetical protein [Streptosporangium saharense]|uniref:hypothetical protein n=1 Tax=Streptosporangium saharense TaxID=1706840 RepID=UPI00331F7A76